MTPTAIKDIQDVLPAMRKGEQIAVVEESAEYPGELAFSAIDQELLVRPNLDYFMSPFSMLSELSMMEVLFSRLESQGWKLYTLPSAHPIMNNFRRWSKPLTIEGFDLGPEKDLFPFQQFGLRKAFDSQNLRLEKDGFYFNFGTGTGKTVVAAAGAQEMFNRGRIDLVIFFALKPTRINVARRIEETTQLKAVSIEGTKDRRRKRYAETTADVLVLNYEKSHFDYEELANLIVGRKVLFVCDEVQKVLRGDNDKNLARKGFDRLVKMPVTSTVWTMSASIVKSNPLRYHDVYNFQTNKNPLGTRKDFLDRYCKGVDNYRLKNGATIRSYNWNLSQLVEVRHRVSRVTQAVRKTDPGVREFFKGMTTEVIRVQRSAEEERLAKAISEAAEEAEANDPSFMITPYYNCLRYMCNTPEALKYSDSDVARGLVAQYPRLIQTPSSKFEVICDKVEQIRDQGDQVVIFTQWTYLTLFLLAKEFKGRGIKYVTHYGTGMTQREAQSAQDRFKADPEITVFLSSDAGAYGLNFQNARFVINVEPPYDPDILMQRNDRIDRADSYLEGLTAYVLIVDDSPEEGIWDIQEARRTVSAATQGTVETLSRYSSEELQMTESQAMRMLMRGGLARR